MRLYLLLYDDFIQDYFFQGVFDDNEEGWEIINRLTAHASGFIIIKGDVIKSHTPEWEAYGE